MQRNGKWLWVLLVGCLCIAIFVAAYPIYVIRPFRAQGASELSAALVVRRWGPSSAVLAAALALVAAALSWRGLQRALRRMVMLVLTTLTVIFAALSHINVYERMFHRIDDPQAMAASEAKLEDDDMVLAIQQGGHARAYPVRMMGYHHIVNDLVGGVPIVATY